MVEDMDFNLTNEPSWHSIIDRKTDEFIEEVFEIRPVDSKLVNEISYELKIVLGLYIATRLNRGHSKEMSLNIVEYFFEEIFSLGNSSKYLRRELVELVSDRHEYYIKGIKNKIRKKDDFFRSIGMHWFQFPLQKKDCIDVPFNYDFSKYFSDVVVVSNVFFNMAPAYAKAIINEIELEYVSN